MKASYQYVCTFLIGNAYNTKMEVVQVWDARDTSTTESKVLKLFIVIKNKTYITFIKIPFFRT